MFRDINTRTDHKLRKQQNDGSLSQKVSRGMVWITVSTFVTKTMYIITAVVLARLLSPADFGLMAIAMTIITFSQSATTTGFEPALIQKQDNTEEFLNAAWSIELIRCVFLAIILFLLAPFLASIFADQRITPILQMLSLSISIGGFRNNGVVFFKKNIQFNKQFILETVPGLARILVVIPLAFFMKSVWALVWAAIVMGVVDCIMTYVMHPHRPHFEWNYEKNKDLFRFSKWIIGQSIINVILNQAVTMFIGKIHGIANLGFYDRASSFSFMFFQQIELMIWRIGYPLYSHLQSAEDRLKRAYLQTSYLLFFIGLPMAGGLFMISDDFVHVLLTDQWLPIVPLMQIFALQSAVRLLVSPSALMFQAVGQPGIGTKITILNVILMVVLIYPLTEKWGLQGTVSVLFFGQAIIAPITLYMGRRISKCTWGELLRPILFSMVSTGVMMATMLVAKSYWFADKDCYGLVSLIFIGIIIYVCTTLLFDKLFQFGVYSIIRQRITAVQ